MRQLSSQNLPDASTTYIFSAMFTHDAANNIRRHNSHYIKWRSMMLAISRFCVYPCFVADSFVIQAFSTTFYGKYAVCAQYTFYRERIRVKLVLVCRRWKASHIESPTIRYNDDESPFDDENGTTTRSHLTNNGSLKCRQSAWWDDVISFITR
jgi:hypothetical protein